MCEQKSISIRCSNKNANGREEEEKGKEEMSYS